MGSNWTFSTRFQHNLLKFAPSVILTFMLAYFFCFILGSVLGLFASEFTDRWGCSQRYRSPKPKKIFITLMSGIAAACLYWWEVEMKMLAPYPVESSSYYALCASEIWFFHVILFTFLLAATLTDFYEMIIPDTITVVGTMFALFCALFIWVALPVTQLSWTSDSLFPVFVEAWGVHLWSPLPADIGTPSLLIMTLLWWFWCFAMLDRVWYTKLPFRKANAIFWRYLYRSPRTKYYVAVALIAPVCFTFVIGSGSAIYLLSALVGMAAGMILVWSVRLVAQWVLGVEAMGFGDVTLMGMIGAFLGWQAVLLIFFIAPFFGLVYGIVHAALGKGRAVPYGPFLCLATVVVVVAWSPIWAATAEYFAFGIGTIGLVLLVLLVLFAGLLHIVHKIMSGLRR